jgi:hypothetical protein
VAAALVTDHGNLSGLTDDDHPQYLSDTDVRPGIAQAVKDSLIPATPVAGGVAYGTATSLNFTTAGTAGQVLTSGGASVPTWTTASSANTASAIVQRDASGNFTAGTITAALTGNADTATTATHLAGGGANRIAYQTGSGASAFAVAPTVTDTFLKWDGSAFAWASAGGANITDDTTTNATYYPTFSASNSGTFSNALTSSTKLRYNPSTGTLSATTFSGALSGNASTATTASTANALNSSNSYSVVNLTASGTVSGSSDERIKTNWRDLPDDFIEKLAKVKHGIYDRTDIELTQVGVGAQSLKEILENAVFANDQGMLSVAYGNAALVACIKLAERVLELEKQLKERA